MDRRWARAVLAEHRPNLEANKSFSIDLPDGCTPGSCKSLCDQVRSTIFPHLKATAAPAKGRVVFVCGCSGGPNTVGEVCTGRLECDWSERKARVAAHSCGCASTSRPNAVVAAGVQVERRPGGASSVAVPQGILWTQQENPGLPADMKEVRNMSVRRRLLQLLGTKLDPVATRVMVMPVIGRVPCVWGDIGALQHGLHDITGPTAVLVCGTAPSAKRRAAEQGPAPEPCALGSVLKQQQATLLFAKVEVSDVEVVEHVRSKIAALDVGRLWSRLPRHTAAGSEPHKVDMVGQAYVPSDPTNLAGWYAGMRRRDAASVQPGFCFAAARELAEAIYDMALQFFPCLAAMRDKLVTPDGQGFLLGRTPFNLVARTMNEGVQVHMGSGDGPLSIFLWVPSGRGVLYGGPFCVPELGLRLLPLNMTLVILAAGALPHGSVAPVVPEGSQAVRMGLSAFLRTRDVCELLQRAVKAGGSEELLALQAEVEVEERMLEARTAGTRATARADAKAERATLDGSRGDGAIRALFDVWSTPSPDAGLERVNFLEWHKY